MVAPVLTTKLQIPPPRRRLVPRRRLLERLDRGLQCKLVLISAPAGFGKTTLLSEWVRGMQAGPAPAARVAWISLDDGDNDPARFAAYLAEALRRADDRIRQAAEDALGAAGPLLQESYLVSLINQIAALPEVFLIVLDDYHAITSQAIHDGVTFLIDHLAGNLHVAIATRADPPLPVARFRGRGQLVELRQSDLRFTVEEAADLLNDAMGLGLSAEDVVALEERTEGWIAGLQLAALSLQGYEPQPTTRSAFIRAFTGSHRYVLDYLIEEVLDQQPAAMQAFLLKTSILERLSGPLCDAVLEVQGSGDGSRRDEPARCQATLEHLEAANLFVVPLDHERRWYRYHRLFADLLRKRLWQTSPELVPVLHRRASAWFEGQGLAAEAIDHALEAGDFERAATLVEDSVEATLMRSEITTFLDWLGRLPGELVRGRPTLCYYHAWALLMSGGPVGQVEELLADMAGRQDTPATSRRMRGRMAALRAYLMVFRVDMQQAAQFGREALEDLPEEDRFLRSVMTWIQSLARLAEGELRDGKTELEELTRMGQEMGNPMITVVALCHRARLQVRQGRLHRARETYERALQWATDTQGRRLPIASEALIGLGELKREWNDLEGAAADLTEAIELAGQWSELASFDAYFPLARTRLALGDVARAREALEAARQIARRSDATKLDDVVAELQEAYFLLLVGESDEVARWAGGRGLLGAGSAGIEGERERLKPPPQEGGAASDLLRARLLKYEQLVLARWYTVAGQAAEALELLEELSAQARQLGRVDLVMEVQILRAVACLIQGREREALEALGEALVLAEPGGYVRLFLDEGEPMARLLGQAAAQGIAPDYVARLLAHVPHEQGAEGLAGAAPGRDSLADRAGGKPLFVEALTGRELEVLRLLATGLSNPEIADELYVAVSTVRTHCKNIYGKLDVHKRWDAVQRGRELGLI